MRREGSPGGTVTAQIMKDVGSDSALELIEVIQSMSANTITTAAGGATYTFENASVSHALQVDDCVIIEASAGSSSNHIQVRRVDSDIWDKGMLMRNAADSDDNNQDSAREWGAILYA